MISVIKESGKLVTKLEGIQGPSGPPGAGSNIQTFTQATPSALWIVNHNSGQKPLVSVFNNNDEEVSVSIVHTSINQFRIISETPFMGYALYK